MQKRRLNNSPCAFTLVEILIVVVIIAILAAIVVPQFADASQDAVAATLSNNLAQLKSAIDYHYHDAGVAAYPATIDATWFADGNMPRHPGNTIGLAAIQVDDTPGKQHPSSKVLKSGVAGAYWYNPAEGIIRARVTNKGSKAKTLELYNLVNHSNETDLGNYSSGGIS